MTSDSDKPLSSAQMKVWPGAKEADGLQKDLGTEPRPPDDLGLYALVLENHRMLKALTERMTTQPTTDAKQPDSSQASEDWYAQATIIREQDIPGWVRMKAKETGQPILIRDGGVCGCVGAHTPTCDRLQEAHRAVVVERASRPLAEPDMQHVLKTGSLPDDRSAPAGSAEWKLACRDAAARINEALGYQTQNPNLEESLAVLRNKAQFGVLAGSAAALVQSAIRDDALEAAAQRAVSGGLMTSPDAQAAAMAIRALKSKPAPVGDYGKFVSAVGRHRAETSQQPAPQPSGNPGEFE